MKNHYPISVYPFKFKIKPRLSDTDASRKVSHVGLSRCFEDARIAVVDFAFKGSGVAAADRRVFMARVANNILIQPESSTPLDVGVGISRIGTSSYVYNVNISQHGVCAAISEAVGVFVNSQGVVVPVHAHERPLLNKVVMNCEDILIDNSRPESKRLVEKNYCHISEYDTRFCETDLFSHVNNVAIVNYYEDSLSEFVGGFIDKKQCRYPDEMVAVKFSDICYLKQIDYPGRLFVASALVEDSSKSMSIYQAMFQGSQCVGVRDVELFKKTNLSWHKCLSRFLWDA